MLKSMLYKILKDTSLKITPTCFGSQRIHHQGVTTCSFTKITCNGSQIFIMCVVGVSGILWTCGVCVCVCVCVCLVTGWKLQWFPARHNAHTHTHTHTPQVQNMPANTDHAQDKYLWIITSNFIQSRGLHSLMMDPLWSETCRSNF